MRHTSIRKQKRQRVSVLPTEAGTWDLEPSRTAARTGWWRVTRRNGPELISKGSGTRGPMVPTPGWMNQEIKSRSSSDDATLCNHAPNLDPPHRDTSSSPHRPPPLRGTPSRPVSLAACPRPLSHLLWVKRNSWHFASALKVPGTDGKKPNWPSTPG